MDYGKIRGITMDEVTLTLSSPMTEEQWDMIADYDFNYTNEITFRTKHGKTVRFVKESAQPKIIRCKECKHYEIWQLKSDYTDDKRFKPSVCVLGRYAVHRPEDWYCADAERRANGRD